MFKPENFRNVNTFFSVSLKCTKGKLKTGVIAHDISFYEAGYYLRSHIRIHDSQRTRLGYSNKGISIA
jgi:hypothetical protein